MLLSLARHGVRRSQGLLGGAGAFRDASRGRLVLAAVESVPGLRFAHALPPADLYSAPVEDQLEWALEHLPSSRVRNFCIIAHIDHGKSTLADLMLQSTGSIRLKKGREHTSQTLDNLEVEQQRGITVKAQTATMLYRYDGDNDAEFGGSPYIVNLIDTPGHADFSYEVKRSLSACDGALLLVDSTQGIQAQTLANYQNAVDAGLTIIPVLTKLDLPHSDPWSTIDQMAAALDGVDPDDCLLTSAKSGEGIDELLPAIVEKIPAPSYGGDIDYPLRCLIFDSWFDTYRGAICIVVCTDGAIRKGDKIMTCLHRRVVEVNEVGILVGESKSMHAVPALQPGQVGYVITSIKSAADALSGDTLVRADEEDPESAMLTSRSDLEVKSVVFASIFPVDQGDFDDLLKSIERLVLNDPSVSVQRETSGALGMGFRCGFLGLLHMDVFRERLSQEHETEVIVTAPMVPYRAVPLRPPKSGGEEATQPFIIATPADFPSLEEQKIRGGFDFYEPVALVSVITPDVYLGSLMKVLQGHRGKQVEVAYFGQGNDDADAAACGRVLVKYLVPWAEVVTDLYDKVKSVSAGYASFEYEEAEPVVSDLVKVDLLLNGNAVDALSIICERSQAQTLGRDLAKRLKKAIKRQQFEVNIQAALGHKILAKTRIPPYRKDVLIKSGKTVGGGDRTRKQKLLQKQKKGKKRMKTVGNVEVTQEAFLSVLKR